MLAAGQRTASVHIAFCPPFAQTPEVSAEQTAGPPARLKTVQVLPYGARFDLKLAAACPESADVLLEFIAECRPAEQPVPAADKPHGGAD